MSSIGETLNKAKWSNTDQLVSSDHFIGVEVELEGRPDDQLRNPPNLWRIVHDGSLRNGAEFIFNEPLKGRAIIDALSSLQRFIDSDGSFHASARCGIHVHLDIRDMSTKQLVNFLMVYILMEKITFSYVDMSRLKNPYCRPLCNSTFKHILHKLNSLEDDSDTNVSKLLAIADSNAEKYAALNIRPITSFGSVEFRMHEGSTNIMRLAEWINIILALKVASLRYSIYDLMNMSDSDAIAAVFSGTSLVKGGARLLSEIYAGMLDDSKADLEEVFLFDSLQEILNKVRSKEVSFNSPRSPGNLSLYVDKLMEGKKPAPRKSARPNL
jgi:hypothetical protein